jgi:hypothetical protein
MQSQNEEVQTLVEDLYNGVQRLVESFRASHVSVTTMAPVTTDENGEPAATATSVEGLSSSGNRTGTPPPGTSVPTSMASVPATSPAVTVNPLIIEPLMLPAGTTTADALIAHLGAVEGKLNDLLILHAITTNPRAKSAGAVAAAAAAAAAAASVPGSASADSDRRDASSAGTGAASAGPSASAHTRGPVPVVVSIQAPNTGYDRLHFAVILSVKLTLSLIFLTI